LKNRRQALTTMLYSGCFLAGCRIPFAVSKASSAPPTGNSLHATNTVITDFRGWGLYPCSTYPDYTSFGDGSKNYSDISWNSPTISDGNLKTTLQQNICALNFTIARLDVPPETGNPDGTLNATYLNALLDNLRILKANGIQKYVLTLWSPPTYMKTPNQVSWSATKSNDPNFNTLNSIYADGKGYDLADYIVQVAQACLKAGYSGLVAVSPQNEPDIAQIYPSCKYANPALYGAMVKTLRAKLNTAKLQSIKILAAETSGLLYLRNYFGEPSKAGFSQLNKDADLLNAITFAWHSYATDKNLDCLTAMKAYPTKERWLTETSNGSSLALLPDYRANTGMLELDWALNYAGMMARDIVDTQVQYWFFWRGWRNSSSAIEEDLTYGKAGTIGLTKSYHMFKKLWNTIVINPANSWTVVAMNGGAANSFVLDNRAAAASDTLWQRRVDVICFKSSNQTVLVISNIKSSGITVSSISGLAGSTVSAFVLDKTRNMDAYRTGNYQGGTWSNVVIPAHSVVLASFTG
jgi:hypothetical protein